MGHVFKTHATEHKKEAFSITTTLYSVVVSFFTKCLLFVICRLCNTRLVRFFTKRNALGGKQLQK